MSHASVMVVLPEDLQPPQIEAALAAQMAPFYENDECFADGSRWDWYVVGGRFAGKLGPSNIVRCGDVDLIALAKGRREYALKLWNDAQKDNAKMREWIFGVGPDETLEQFMERKEPSFAPVLPPHYAMLRSLHWNERERMGWFGMSTATECERRGETVPRCLHKDEKTGARIVSWQCDQDSWDRDAWPKLVATIEPRQWLVTVDYHV
jgi:hypothetical protein